jgi:predicted MFS family arabinose efflux permease
VIFGPFVGGLLVNSISWRAAFLINVPLLIVAYYATTRYVPESRDEDASGHFDWAGATLVALAVGGLAFGTIRGQQTGWRGAAPFIALGVGALATIAFPILMARSNNPLVPLYLFKSRNFTVTNISTFVIYAALYVTFTFLAIFVVGTLGYNEPAAGIAGLPSGIWLALFSTRFGKLAARYGPRIFMAVGPAVMGLGLMWLARVPASSQPWIFGTSPPASILPPTDYFIDFLPGFVVFGIGLMIMVAPLTTALMTSVSAQHSGLASAINNAISRVGSPLVGALIFVAVSASFYSSIAERVPGTDVSSSEFRQQVAPLNPPAETVPPEVRAAAREASTSAFHLAMLVSAGLLFVGAAVNAVGIRNPSKEEVERELAQVRPPDEQPVLAAPTPPIPEKAAGGGNPRPEGEQSS